MEFFPKWWTRFIQNNRSTLSITSLIIIPVDWFPLLQTLGIIGAFGIAIWQARVMMSNQKVQVLSNLITSHRELWKLTIESSSLSRILQKNLDLNSQPVTQKEESFVQMLIIHLRFVYYASKNRIHGLEEGDKLDILFFFSLPIPKQVWENTKKYHSSDFVKYVDNVLKSKK